MGKIGTLFLATLLATASLGAQMREWLFEAEVPAFSQENYTAAVEALFQAFEAQRGEAIAPGETGRVGLKIFTGMGAGLSTPKPLVRATIAALEKRGFTREQLFLIDQEASRLRAAGYLPPLSERAAHSFEGVPVIPFVSQADFNTLWFYESALPPANQTDPWRTDSSLLEEGVSDRKSYLPTPLLLECDFWINLPVYVDHPALGISGAMANASIWSISNYRRFLNQPASAAVVASEISAIPELDAKWLFTIATLERYQFVGGPIYNELYVRSENRLWLSANPVVLDYLMYLRINKARAGEEFPLIAPRPPVIDYGQTLGLGDYDPERIRYQTIPIKETHP